MAAQGLLFKFRPLGLVTCPLPRSANTRPFLKRKVKLKELKNSSFKFILLKEQTLDCGLCVVPTISWTEDFPSNWTRHESWVGLLPPSPFRMYQLPLPEAIVLLLGAPGQTAIRLICTKSHEKWAGGIQLQQLWKLTEKPWRTVEPT